MIVPLNAYPDTGDSPSPWLGSRPCHWGVRRLRQVLTRVAERDRSDLPLLSVVREKGVILRDISSKDENHNFVPDDLSNYKVVRAGQFAMNKMKAWQGSFGVSEHTGIVSPAYFVFDLRGVEGAFFHSAIRSRAYVPFFAQASDGVRVGQWDLAESRMKEIPFLVPPPCEQSAIIRFLAHTDSKIRRAISVKQKLIQLLEEQKQAIIHRAVTRGLDPSVPLKPSGAQWLGDVPMHWAVRRLRTLLAAFEQGVSPQAENRLADAASWGVLKSGCVNHGVFRESEHKRLPAAFEFDPGLRVVVGDVLVSRASGSTHLVGSVGRVEAVGYRLILSDKTFRLTFRETVDPDFMVLAMNGRYYRQQVEQAISGAEGLANNLPSSSLRAFVFAIPDRAEQQRIVMEVRLLCDSVMRAIQRAAAEVALLREYRTRLVADVVTGKLDVRAAAAKLPGEAAELPADEIDDVEGEAEDDVDEGLAEAEE